MVENFNIIKIANNPIPSQQSRQNGPVLKDL